MQFVQSPTYTVADKTIVMSISLLVILLGAITLCSGQTFNISRDESGDEVSSSMTVASTAAAYCTSIQAYLSESKCKCNFRRTFSLDLQTCIDYYNGKGYMYS